MQTVKLANGVHMPVLGYGVFQVSPEECVRCVKEALACGYRSIDESLRKLQTDYLDLLLIHQPFGDYYGTWRAMEAAYKAGKARAIGVSNFYPDRLIDIAHFNEIKPMVNQVETHVFNQQTAAQKTMKKLECALMSWAPLAEGRNGLFTEFPAGSPGLEPREECGLSKFFNLGANAAKPCT